MCIAVFLWQSHPLYPFILLLNRDEFHNRPTTAAEWWEAEEIVGGRDEQGGGTWLGCSKNGKVAFLTNFRETHKIPDAKSRGDLPVRFLKVLDLLVRIVYFNLKSEKDPAEFADEVLSESDHFNGFNLVLVDLFSKTMVYVTNRPKHHEPYAMQVSSGIHVLTNSSLDSPWPKAQRLHDNFKKLMDTYGEDEVQVQEMVKLMMDTTKSGSLPGILPPEFEHPLNSIFVDTDTPLGRYGTRSTSAVIANVKGEISFHERHLEDDSWQERVIKYQAE